MPLPPIPDGLYISVAQLKAFLRCPAFFAYKYRYREPAAFVPTSLAFGSAIHAALAAYYSEIKVSGEPLALELLIDVFRDAWARAADGPVPLQLDDEDDDSLDQLIDKGVLMLRAFHTTGQQALQGADVDAVEHSFAVAITDPATGELLEEQLIGAMDLLLRESSGRRTIVEHKSAARRWSAEAIRFDLQPTAYKVAARASHLGEVGLRLQVLTKTRTPGIQIADLERTPRDEADFMKTVVGVLSATDSGIDYPTPSWACRSCPYAYTCRQP